MEKLFDVLMTDPTITKVVDCFGLENDQSLVYGLAGSQKAAVIAASYEKHPRTT
ncbi:MAG: hypothetical protein H6Q70_4580, partial [Firmicutes bacterium]|nr:hypothetical protein [Bacillota bacterium]